MTTLPANFPTYPPEFLTAIKDTGLITLTKWMRDNHAPQSAIDLLDAIDFVWFYRCELSDQQLPPSTTQLAVETIALMTVNIVALGGDFYSAYGSSRPSTTGQAATHSDNCE